MLHDELRFIHYRQRPDSIAILKERLLGKYSDRPIGPSFHLSYALNDQLWGIWLTSGYGK